MIRQLSAKSGFAALLVLSSLSFAPPALAKPHPYSQAFVTQAHSLFFEGGRVSPAKVDAYIAKLKQKREEMRSLHVGQLAMSGERDPKKVNKEVDDEKALAALDTAIASLETMKKSQDEGVIFESAAMALDIESSFRIFGPPANWARQQLFFGLRSWAIPKQSAASEEASDLYDHVAKRYLSVADIEDLKRKNADLSLFSPGPNSPAWQNVGDISRVDVKTAARGGSLKLYANGVEYPADRVYHYDEIKHNDTKPKMDVFTRDAKGKKKAKFKLKFGAEIHTEPTTAAISMALGFPADITEVQRDIKVYLGKAKLSDVKRDWEVYYLRDYTRGVYKFEDYVKSVGKDKDGDFVIFKEAAVDAKPKEIHRLGGWAWGDLGHNDMRAIRGLSIVQLWMTNNDMKEFDNNRMLLARHKDGTVSRHLMVSDMGATFGSPIFAGFADLFRWKFVDRQTDKEIILNHMSFHPNKVRNTPTLADARWAARLMAKLSRKQIADAVAHGDWPECMQPVLVEKLIHRRNDLIHNLGLNGARQDDGTVIALLPNDLPKSQLEVDKLCKNESLDEKFTMQFEMGMPEILRIVRRQLHSTGLNVARMGVNSLRRFQISGPQLGLDKNVITDAIVDVDRTVERNPNPTSEQDIYLMKDRFEVGFRLGLNFGPYVDFIYTRSFTLVYPVRSIRENDLKHGFIVDVLLPIHLRQGNVPEKYVLMTEHYIEKGAGIQIDRLEALISPVLVIGGSRIFLARSVFDHRDPAKYVFYRDRAVFQQGKLELLLRLAIIKLPIFRSLYSWGQASGRGSTFSAEEVNGKAGSDAILRAMAHGDFQGIEPREHQFELTNSFKASASNWKFLFWSGSRSKQLDQIVMTDSKVAGRSGIQFRTTRETGVNVMGDKESKAISVETFTDVARPNGYQINVKVMAIDTDTQEKHLAGRYLPFINGLSVDGRKVINLTPSLGYTVNQRWGTLVITSDTHFNEVAVGNILKSTPAQFWNSLAGSIGVTPQKLEEMKKDFRAANSERGSRGVRSQEQVLAEYGLSQDDGEMLKEAQLFLKRIENAKKETSMSKRVKSLSEAIRQAVFVGTSGFYSSRVLGALTRLSGTPNLYSRNMISAPPFMEQNLIEEVPMFGEIGTPMETTTKYLIYKPVSTADLYTMFDSWF